MLTMNRTPWAVPRRGRRPVAFAAVTALLAGLVLAIGASEAKAATVDTNAWYVLINRHSGKVLDVSNLATGDGAPIHQWDRTNATNQQWQFIDSGGGYYRLRARHSGKVMEVFNWSTTDGADIVQWGDHNGTNQQFRLADSADGYVRLLNRNSGKAVEVQDLSTANGGKIVQYYDWGGANQQWQLVPVGGTSGSLPSTFRWSSSGVLIGPKSDATHSIRAVKDPSVVHHNGRYHVFASTTNNNGAYSMVYLNFTDWSQAGSAQHHYLDRTAIGGGYKAAPHVFYFAPQRLWYLVFQTGDNAAYSTTSD
ncbi:non-reducing end alpha-L-arabinofuranosidase family hydrolase, partial [Saccharothrix deserti]|uniref:non-reducing end alpha-L-arabinofuranosidase family hydrolase n=1 Tax=Saccharothrix deserti TaxID=2593674 RepID=UPI00192E717E